MFLVGVYEKEITPPLGFNIPGYFNARYAKGVKSRLYARAMVISDGENRIAIAGLDGLLPPRDLRVNVLNRLAEYSDIPADNVLLFVNHTHTGIPLKNKDATADELEYWHLLTYLLADTIVLAEQRLVPARILFARGNVDDISFVRDYYMKNTTPTTNPGRCNPNIIGPTEEIDPDLPVLFAESENGEPIGALLCFACHQDCVGGDEYCSDFSGIVITELKKMYGDKFVALFMEGTAGNVNYTDVSRTEVEPDYYVKMGKRIADETMRVLSAAEYLADKGVGAMLKTIPIPPTEIAEEEIKRARHLIATVTPIEGEDIRADDSEQYYLRMAQRLIGLIDSRPEFYTVPVQVLRVGNYLLYGFPSEIYTTFGREIKDKSPVKDYTIATLCNISYGYVPSRELFYPTVYSSKPGANLLHQEAGYMMSEKLLEMADELMRDVLND